MKKRIVFLFLFLTIVRVSFSQNPDDKRDNTWLFGYGSNDSEPPFGWTTLDFANDSLDIFYQHRYMDIFEENTSICDTNGNLLFYTNGVKIANANNQLMLNGSGLNPGIFTTAYPSGLLIPQGALALPIPGSDSLYILIHGYMNVYEDPDHPIVCISNLFYSLIDMSKANGEGAVIEKNIEILTDTLALGKITAVRHGNGRDWWIVVPEHSTNCYYRFLLTTNGLSEPEKQCVGEATPSGLGQAVFSPNGAKYARYDGYHLLLGNYFNVYNFDRCSGLLSNHQQMHIIDTGYSAGIAISPNSRFAYLPSYNYVYQLDLQASDLEESKTTVATYDSFVAPASTTFYLAQLAPNDKIYICSPNGVNYLHIINYPNEPGLACEVVQHGVELPAYSLTMPNFPNFRLGKWEGSPCDTITISSTSVDIPFPKVFIYPNPASDFVMVENNLPNKETLHLTLFDATGRPVLYQKIENGQGENRIDLSNFAPGLYFFKLESNGKQLKTGKLLVVKP